MATQYQLIFSCTLAQFNIAVGTTLPAAGFSVVQAPQRFAGILVSQSGGAVGTGQTDFNYDGYYFLTFFGANMTPAMVTYLTTTLAGTLGAPVPPNQAIPPYNTNTL